VTEQVAIIAHEILNDAEDAADEDQDAGGVQHVEVFLPVDWGRGGHCGKSAGNAAGIGAAVEEDGDDYEDGEEENLGVSASYEHARIHADSAYLHEETGNDEMLASSQ
jgi:hypothetical protein